MQIQTGRLTNTTCAVTNGSATVIAAAGSDWSSVTAGSVFTVAGSFVPYFVAADATFVSGAWRITLAANYAGTTNAVASYAIEIDFGANGEPIFKNGDTEILTLLNRWMAAQAAAVAQLTAGGTPSIFTNIRKSPIDGTLEILNPTQSKWFSIGLVGAAGDEQIKIAETGES